MKAKEKIEILNYTEGVLEDEVIYNLALPCNHRTKGHRILPAERL